MNTRSRLKHYALAVSIAALLAPLTSRANTYYWDGGNPANPGNGASDGGTGVWDTTLANWDVLPSGSAHIVWPNSTDEAVFGGTAGTVSLGTTITANTLTFAVGGYTISNGGNALNTLTLAGSTPTISVVNAADTATISAALVGTSSLTKAGNGTLVLSGTNTFSGGLAITGGVVTASTVGNLGAGGIELNGGTLRTTETAALTFAAGNIITVDGAGGTLDNTAAFKLLINTAGGLTGSGTFTRTASANNTLVGSANNDLQISVANTGFTGAVILNGGQNEISTNGLGTGASAGNTITVNSGAELTASNGTISNALILNAGANIGGDNGTSTFAGPVTVNGAFKVRLGDFYQGTNRSLIISGALTGTGAITLLSSNSNTVPTTGTGQTLFLNGDNSAYTSNIAFVAGYNVSFGTATSSGTGTVTINSTTAALGGVGYGYDFGATVPTFANTRTSTTTGGVFGLNTTLAATTTLNLATLGGGGMFLGSQSAGTYAATTLTPDGTTYRLGGGLGVLTLTGTNALTGATAVVAGDTRTNGTGTVVLAAANDYTGTTTVNGGTTLQVSNNGALGSATTGTTVNAGGSLGLSGNVTINEPLNVTGTSSTATTTNLVNGLVNVSGTNTFAGLITATTGSANFRIAVTTGTLNLPGNISLSGGGTSFGLAFAGVGTINQTGVLSGNGSVFVTSTGTVNPSVLNNYTGATTFQNGTGIYNVQIFNSVAGGVAASSLGAPTTVSTGTLNFGASSTAGSVTYTGTGETTDRVINLAGTTGGGTITNSGTGLLKFTSNLTATGLGTKTLTLGGSTSGIGELAGVIVNSTGNVTNLAKTGSGVWRLTGLSTYSGTTAVNQGTLVINTLGSVNGAASSLGTPTSIANGTISLGSGTTSPQAGTLQYIGTGSISDRAINLASTTGGGTLDQSGTGTFQVGNVTATGAGSKTLTLTGSTAGVGVVAGPIVNNSATNTTAVTKSGSGVWTLAGANTYTGATTISAGLLRINGDNSAATGAVAVNAGGYLGGTGKVGGAVTVAANGGIDLRDGAVGKLTLNGALTLNGTTSAQDTLYFDLGSSTVDSIAATGAVTATTSGATLITFNQLAGTPLANGTYTLITSAATSVPTGFALATTQSGGHTYSLTTGTTGNILQVTVGTAATGPAAAVWGGTASGTWTAAGNWYTDATSGTLAGAAPGVGTNVTFSTTTPTPANLSTTLGADIEINSLTFLNTATSPVTIAGSTNALTIDAGTANGNTAGNGISQLAAATQTISSRLGLASAQTWTVAAGGGLTVSGLVFDTGSGFTLTKAGDGTLTLSGTANTFTGDINVTGGVLAFAGNNGANGDPLSLGAGGKTITVTNNAILRPTTSANPTSTNTKHFVVGAGGATFDVLNGVTFTLDDATQFSGTGDLTVTGAGTGTVALTGQSFNFSGNVIVNSGTLRLGSGAVLGTAAGRTITVNSNGSLDANNTVTTANVPLDILLNGGTLSAVSANGTFAHAIILTANSTLSAGSNFTETVSGNITGAFSLTKSGTGITVLSGTNTYGVAGGPSTTVSTGILQAAMPDSLPGYDTAGQVSVLSGATLALNVGGTNDFATSDVLAVLNSGAFASGSGIGFDTTNAGGSFTAPAIVATPAVTALNLTKLGTGTLVLPNVNGFATGTTTILNGTLSVASGVDNTLGTGALVIGATAGTPANLDLGATSQTVATLTAPANSTTVSSSIAIGDGETLLVKGLVTIGSSGTTTTTKLNVTGANGTFSIGTAATPTNANVQIGGNIADGLSNGATLDLSGVGTFFANLGTGIFRVGDLTNSTGTATLGSTLILAPTSTIIATTITSDSPDSGQTQTMKLGSGANSFQANTIAIGGSSNRANGILSFNGPTGTLKVRGLAGGSTRALFNVAYGNSTTAATPVVTVDLTGHSVDLMLSALNVAGRTGNTGGNMTGTFSFDTGTIDTTGIVVATRASTASTSAGTSTGIINLNGGTVTVGTSGIVISQNTSTLTTNLTAGTVNVAGAAVTVGTTATAGNITLGSAANVNGPATATLNITDGSLTVHGTIAKGAVVGAVTSTLTLNGTDAVLDMTGHAIGTAAAPINTLNFSAGTLQNVTAINGTAGLTKSGNGTLILAGTNTYSGGTNVATGTVLVSGSLNGSVSVANGATLGGAGTIFTGAAGSVTVAASGIVAPGNGGIGKLTIDALNTPSPALSLSNGATFSFELNTGVWDQIAITDASSGSIAFSNNTINFSDLSSGGLAPGDYVLFTANAPGAYTGLSTDAQGYIQSGLAIGSGLESYPLATLQLVGNDIVLKSIPEPGSLPTLLAGFGALLGLQRLRRRVPRRGVI